MNTHDEVIENDSDAGADGRSPLLSALVGGANRSVAQPHDGSRDAVAVEDDGADDSAVALIAEDCPNVSREVIADILCAAGERGLLAGRGERASAASDSEWLTVARTALKVLEYQARKGDGPLVRYAALYVWDFRPFDDINRHLSQQDFANTIVVKYEVTDGKRQPIYLTKAAVNNACEDARKFFGLPPRQDQRSLEARGAMSDARKANLQAVSA